MTEFDSGLIFGIGLTILTFILSLINSEENRKKWGISCVVIFFFTLIVIIMGFSLHWDSTILNIPSPDISEGNPKRTPDGIPEPDSTPDDIPKPDSTPDDIPEPDETPEPFSPSNSIFTLGEAYESHTSSDVSSSVEFRKWDSNKDKDLRNDSHENASGISYYANYSNLFNFLGAGGSESDRIVSEIHIPLVGVTDEVVDNLRLRGAIVAEQRTEDSKAYADVAISIDGVEHWREHITSTTVAPVDFDINLTGIKSEIVITTSCVPLGSGLALGYVDLNIDISESPIGGLDSGEEDNGKDDNNNGEDDNNSESLFVRAFETHSPDNDVINNVEFRWWDSFKDADLRTNQYIESGGLFLKFSDLFCDLGASTGTEIKSEIHLVVNPRVDISGVKFTGQIVAEQSTQGSKAYANFIILVDGVERWRSGEAITGSSIAPIDFEVDLSDALYEVTLITDCFPHDKGLAIGIVNLNHQKAQ